MVRIAFLSFLLLRLNPSTIQLICGFRSRLCLVREAEQIFLLSMKQYSASRTREEGIDAPLCKVFLQFFQEGFLSAPADFNEVR